MTMANIYLEYTHLVHFFMELLILLYYLRGLVAASTLKKHNWLIGIMAMLLPVILYTDYSLIHNTVLRLLYRTSCYIVCIRNLKRIRWKNCLYYALVCMVIFTANTNIWQTPFLYSISRSQLLLHPWWQVNILLCSCIEYIACFSMFFIFTHSVHLNEIMEVRYHRFMMVGVILTCQLYVKSSLNYINSQNSSAISHMSYYAIFLQLVLIALLVIYERYLYSRRMEEMVRIQKVGSSYQQKALQLQQANAENLRQINHDIKNHLLAIHNYCRQGKNREAEHYIQTLLPLLKSGASTVETGNDLLNGLFAQKLFEAMQQEIDVSIIMDGRPISFIQSNDLCTIFANVLDNAIEASAKLPLPSDRFISIKGGLLNEQYIFSIFNSYSAPVKMWNGIPLTNKENTNLHGFGIRIVRKTIEKYNGTLIFDTNDPHTFKLTIMFPLNQIRHCT